MTKKIVNFYLCLIFKDPSLTQWAGCKTVTVSIRSWHWCMSQNREIRPLNINPWLINSREPYLKSLLKVSYLPRWPHDSPTNSPHLFLLSLHRGSKNFLQAYYLCSAAYRGLLLFKAQPLNQSINDGPGIPLYGICLVPTALTPLSRHTFALYLQATQKKS